MKIIVSLCPRIVNLVIIIIIWGWGRTLVQIAKEDYDWQHHIIGYGSPAPVVQTPMANFMHHAEGELLSLLAIIMFVAWLRTMGTFRLKINDTTGS